MAKYFNSQLTAPIRVQGADVPQGAGIYRSAGRASETDEEKKRQALRDSYAGSKTDVTVDAAPTMKEPDGMTLNLPPTVQTYADPNKFREGLAARGYLDEWNNIQKSQLDQEEKSIQVQNAQLDTHMKHLTMGVQALYAGDPALAATIVNKVEPDGQKIKGFKVVDKDNFIVYSEDKPEGQKMARSEVEGLAMDAKSRADRYFPLRYETVGDKIIGVQRHMLSGKEDIKFTIDNPLNKTNKKFTPFEQEMQQQAVKMYVDSIGDDKKAEQKLARVDDATQAFLSFTKGGNDTGVKYSVGIPPWAVEAQTVDRKFKALNLDEMVSMFQGMSRAVDSDAERAFFEQKQPNIKNQKETNAQILVATYALSAKQLADNKAKRDWINSHSEEAAPLKGYESPVLGKQTTVFSKDGSIEVVNKDEVSKYEKRGYLSTDAYAAAMLNGARPAPKMPDMSGEGASKKLDRKAPTVTTKEDFDRLPSGTEYINSKGQRARKP